MAFPQHDTGPIWNARDSTDTRTRENKHWRKGQIEFDSTVTEDGRILRARVLVRSRNPRHTRPEGGC